MTILLAAAAFAAAQTAAAPSQDLRAAWATFSKTPAFNRISERVEVATMSERRPDGLQFLLRRTLTNGGKTEVSWTNTIVCPGARAAIGAMEAISVSPDVPGFGAENDRVILDGVGYSLDAPASLTGGGTRLRISSNVNTSLAAWMESTLKILQPCWTASPPR